MTYDVDNLPEGLRTPPKRVDPVEAKHRAESLLGEIQSAKDRGLLNRERTSRALGELNVLLMDVGTQYQQARIDTLRAIPRADGSAEIHPFGTKEQVARYSRTSNAYSTILDAMNLVERLAEGLE